MGRAEKRAVNTARAENKAQLNALERQQLADIQNVGTDYTPEQKAAIRRARLSSIDEGYAGAGDEATRRYARTGATAGFSETLGELALQRTREKSRAGAELETDFAQEPLRRSVLRANLRLPLYGTRAGLYGQTIPNPGSVNQGWWESWGRDLLGAGAQAGSAAILAACWIAAALYGENHGKTLVLRYYVNEVWPQRITGRVFRSVYLTIGQRVAGWVSVFRHLNVVMRKLFDALHRRALRELND